MKTTPRAKPAKQDAKPASQVMKTTPRAKPAQQDAKPARQVMKTTPRAKPAKQDAKPARQVMKSASKANVVAKVEKSVMKAVARAKGVKQVKKKMVTRAKPAKEVMKTASKGKPAVMKATTSRAKPAVMKDTTSRAKPAVMKATTSRAKGAKEVMKKAGLASPAKEVMKRASVASPAKDVMKRASVASKPKSAKASGKTVRKPSSRKASSKKASAAIASSVPASPIGIKVTKSPSKASTPKKQSVPVSVSPLLNAPTVATPKTPPVSILAPALSSETRMVTKSFRGKIPVDDYVPNVNEYTVYEDKEATWACMLNQSNVGANNNKFYVIQLLTRGTGFYVWKRWGRVGAQGQSEFSAFNDVFSAKNEFASKFRSKTSVSWQNRKAATPEPGKYAFIEMDYEVPDATVAKITDYEPCKLPTEVQHLIKLICDVDMMKKSLIEVGYDAKKMPLGKISPAMVSAGYQKLKEIESELGGKNKIEELQRLSSEFFTVIPHDFGFKQMSEFTINDKKKLKEKLELVEALNQIEVAHKLLSQELNSKENPITKKYEMLDCGLTPLKRGGSEWKMVETYAQNTHGDPHSYYRLVLKNLFEVDKPK